MSSTIAKLLSPCHQPCQVVFSNTPNTPNTNRTMEPNPTGSASPWRYPSNNPLKSFWSTVIKPCFIVPPTTTFTPTDAPQSPSQEHQQHNLHPTTSHVQRLWDASFSDHNPPRDHRPRSRGFLNFRRSANGLTTIPTETLPPHQLPEISFSTDDDTSSHLLEHTPMPRNHVSITASLEVHHQSENGDLGNTTEQSRDIPIAFLPDDDSPGPTLLLDGIKIPGKTFKSSSSSLDVHDRSENDFQSTVQSHTYEPALPAELSPTKDDIATVGSTVLLDREQMVANNAGSSCSLEVHDRSDGNGETAAEAVKHRHEADLPNISFSTTEGDIGSTAQAIHVVVDTPDVIVLSKREAERTIAEMEAEANKSMFVQDTPGGSSKQATEAGIPWNAPPLDELNEGSSGEATQAPMLIPSQKVGGNAGNSSEEPTEPPMFTASQKVFDKSGDVPVGKKEAPRDCTHGKTCGTPGCSCKPERIRFSRRGKKALAVTRKRSNDDPLLNYNKGLELGALAAVREEVGKLQKMLESTRPGVCAGGKGEDNGIVEEVESFVNDVHKVAQRTVQEMASATKRRSDLFVERVRGLENGVKSRQESEIDGLIQKVLECEKHNKELKESLRRTRERFSLGREGIDE